MVWARTAIALALLAATPVIAADPDARALAKDPVRFLETAQKTLHWKEPVEPTRIVGPVHFVGTRGLAAWLITTPKGHILLNTAMPGSGPMIATSVRKLGFKPEDVKILLASHAHVDHVGGHAYVQKLSGARVAMMAEEVELLESGGKSDFQYGAYPQFAFDPVTVEQTLHDGDVIELGDVKLTALLTPGHTKGSTTFVTSVADATGRRYTIVFPSGTSINPGYRLVKDPSYPGIVDDYRRTFGVLEALTPDIWLDAHTDVFKFAEKRARAARQGIAAWVDPAGYRQWLRGVREKFDATIAAESSAPQH